MFAPENRILQIVNFTNNRVEASVIILMSEWKGECAMANISFLPKDLALPKVWALPSTLLSVLRIVYGLLLVEHSIGHFFLSFPHASFIREFPPGRWIPT